MFIDGVTDDAYYLADQLTDPLAATWQSKWVLDKTRISFLEQVPTELQRTLLTACE